MQNLGILLKMGFIKLTVTIAQQQEGILSDGCFLHIQDLSCRQAWEGQQENFSSLVRADFFLTPSFYKN